MRTLLSGAGVAIHYGNYQKLLLLCLLLFPLWAGSPSVRADESFSETRVKVAYIYNFIRFVSWPDTLKNEHIHLCIYDADENVQAIFNALPEVANNKPLSKRLIRADEKPGTIDHCEIVFVASLDEHRVKQILAYHRTEHILTIGDSPHFLEYGGIVKFIRLDDKIRFEINLVESEKAGLKISSQVLRIAVRLVTSG